MLNENAFFDELILMYLYKKEQVSTLKMENLFGGSSDFQNVNNVVSNRTNGTSYIKVGYMEYNEKEKTLTITKEGKKFIEGKFSSSR